MKLGIGVLLVLPLMLSQAVPVAIAAEDPVLVLQGGKVYASPSAAAVDDAVLLIQDGRVAAVGKRTQLQVPKSARVIDCTGKVIVAGFWNSHVHFESGWADAAHAPAEKIDAHMQEMLTRWGFTTVWDLGSEPNNTLALRRRIEGGEISGPQILMAGDIFPTTATRFTCPPKCNCPRRPARKKRSRWHSNI